MTVTETAFCLAGALALTGACASTDAPPPTKPKATIEVVSRPIVRPLEGPVPAWSAGAVDGVDSEFQRLFGDNVKSLLVKRSTLVRASPLPDSQALGVLAGGTRVRWRGHVVSEGCKHPWIEIEPKGWICASVEATDKEPSDQMLPILGNRRVPGVYGRVRKSGLIFDSKRAIRAGEGRVPDGDVVRRKAVVRIDGRTFWRTQNGSYVDSGHVSRYWGSEFKGVDLEAEELSLPIAFAVRSGRRARKKSVIVRSSPRRRARRVGTLSPRQVVSVIDRTRNGKWVQIADQQWVARKDLRIAEEKLAPSKQIDHEIWADINLDEQVIVLYRDGAPIFATMVSTGKFRHGTPIGVFRIDRKKALTTMTSRPASDEVYSVADVPWTLYFHKGYALHGAYWHDSFGSRRSHGCINLSPSDAKRIYTLLGPTVPAGWSAAYGDEQTPGSVVRIRNKRHPKPKFRGYAAKLHKQSLSRVALAN